MMDGLMEVVHDKSLPTIELLQSSFPNEKDLMISISTLFDPRYVFLVYAPILFALNKRVGHRMIVALTLAEWTNQILKWLLAGERPYWYVHERAHGLANSSMALAPGAGPQLKQFPVTCELGAGSPSGHSMVTATVWYILIDACLRGELAPAGRPNYSCMRAPGASKWSLADRLSWSLYALMLVSVSLSRVYLACHFPHQCLVGALLGAGLARLVCERAPMERLTRLHFGLATCLMFASALGTYALLRLTGFDPLWSVDKAMRWCVSKDYIHLDTTPFFSMTRYLGFCLGAGLAHDATKLVGVPKGAGPGARLDGQLVARRLLAATLAIAFGQLLLALPAPKSNLNLFYLISFAIYATFSYAIAGPIPRLAKHLVPASRRPAAEPLKSR